MITYREALDLIHKRVRPVGDDAEAALMGTLGRIIARDILADRDIPPFNRVTMDGYAVVAADGAGIYPVVDSVPAGSVAKRKMASGEVMMVMTGAPLPAGADAVVPVEKTGGYVAVGESATITGVVAPGESVAPQGEDRVAGNVVLPRGTVVGAAEMAIMAMVGAVRPTLYRRPTVAILSTGDELTPPDVTPGPGKIRDSNATGLAAQLALMGLEATIIDSASDERDDLERKLGEGAQADFLLITGGVSAGNRDFVPELLQAQGYEKCFHKVRIKPGKPVWFGVSGDNRYAFGLPGNPVSTYLLFALMVKPALRFFGGGGWCEGEYVTARLEQDYSRRGSEREEFVPVTVRFEEGGYIVSLSPYHGSGHLHALSGRNGLLRVPVGVDCIAAKGLRPVTCLKL